MLSVLPIVIIRFWAGRVRLPFGVVLGGVFGLLQVVDSEKYTDRHCKRRGSGSGDAVCVGFVSLATGVPLSSFVVVSGPGCAVVAVSGAPQAQSLDDKARRDGWELHLESERASAVGHRHF